MNGFVIIGKSFGWISPNISRENGHEIPENARGSQQDSFDRHILVEEPEAEAEIDVNVHADDGSGSEDMEVPSCHSDDAAGWG